NQSAKPNENEVTIAGEPQNISRHTPNRIDPTKTPPGAVASQDIDSLLNPRYSFDNFIEGESNRLVRAVAERIATEPGKTAFNPLFIYGASGVGKTHVCHATGLKIRELYPQKRVVYVSSNLLRLQFTDAVRKNVINDFLTFYQSIDVLLIDDIHEMIGMTKTQNIFFQIFNNLHQLGKQLVLTCDRPPVDLQGMEDRLISRLRWGMTAQIERPDIELRKSVLRNMLTREGLKINNEVFDFISENVTENIRDLEGVLVSLMAHSIHTDMEIDLALAKQVVSRSVRLEKKQCDIKKIQAAVCRFFNLDESLVQTRSRKREIVNVRQIIVYFAKNYTNSSWTQIGKMVGNIDHATAIYSYNTVAQQMQVNKTYRTTVETIATTLK
ncbi:MAG: chromosomal replication initiator protein DnaA, partial [Tannerella sp.]|nr:chromosomal replication initiator protein DnaA [Tannerella sp.]